MSGRGPSSAVGRCAVEYRIEDLAHASGATVRTIRSYQDRGLLPTPERRGRANVYRDTHLARLRQIADLLDRGYTLASIKELLNAWDTGRGLAGVLGPVAGVHGLCIDEQGDRITRAELISTFGHPLDDGAIADAVELGVLVPIPGRGDEFLVASRQELSAVVELQDSGVSVGAMSLQLREFRDQVRQIAVPLMELVTDEVFARCFGHGPPTHADAAEEATSDRRLRPLSQRTADLELACEIGPFAFQQLRDHLDVGAPFPSKDEPSWTSRVDLPLKTIRSIQRLVGAEHVAAFVAAAAEREVQSRTLDALTPSSSDNT